MHIDECPVPVIQRTGGVVSMVWDCPLKTVCNRLGPENQGKKILKGLDLGSATILTLMIIDAGITKNFDDFGGR